MKKILFAISSAVIISACGGGGDTATAEKPLKDTFPLYCTYLYDASSTTIGFGAFKFTEKKEVKGEFIKFTVEGTEENDRPFFVFKSATFKIEVEGLNTNDQARDYNIKSSFFAKMDSTSIITGKVKEIYLDSVNNYCVLVTLKLNNVEKDIEMALRQEGDVVSITGSINLNDFKAQKALASLNTTCKDLHKGSDGKSVTWPEVNIYVSTTLKKNFPKK